MVELSGDVYELVTVFTQITLTVVLFTIKRATDKKKSKWYVKLGKGVVDLSFIILTLLWVMGYIHHTILLVVMTFWAIIWSITRKY